MKISFRGWLAIGLIVALLMAVGFRTQWLQAQSTAALRGQLSESSLGNLLASMGLQPKKIDGRYDFTFKTVQKEQQWDLSMSAVLSRDGQTIWIMAWLDELPRSAADVPRTALLRLLASNDQMGNGKFFAYVAGNRRFVLQQVIPNRGISTTGFRDILKDLQGTVIATYPSWSVANWSAPQQTPTTPASVQSTSNRAPIRSVLRDSKFDSASRR